jgi:hypothetical protein
MKKYTIEQTGPEAWVVSDGTTHVETDDPIDGLVQLEQAAIDAEHTSLTVDESVEIQKQLEISDRIGNGAVRLIRLLAMNAPPPVLENEVRVIGKLVGQWIAHRPPE